MADNSASETPKKSKTSKPGKTSTKPRKTVAKTANAKEKTPVTNTATTPSTTTTDSTTAAAGSDNRAEAKSRFNAALEEAKAGAAALRAEGKERAVAYRENAKDKGEGYAAEAKTKSRDLANQGKAKAGEGLRALSGAVSENAHYVDEHLGAKYGDYARSASRSLDDYAGRLDEKSIDELGQDAREFVRKSPGLAVGMAAAFGFMLSRMLGGSRR